MLKKNILFEVIGNKERKKTYNCKIIIKIYWKKSSKIEFIFLSRNRRIKMNPHQKWKMSSLSPLRSVMNLSFSLRKTFSSSTSPYLPVFLYIDFRFFSHLLCFFARCVCKLLWGHVFLPPISSPLRPLFRRFKMAQIKHFGCETWGDCWAV